MFTWDSSGCMSKESVSIMYYQTHKQIDRNAQKLKVKSHYTVGCYSSCNHKHQLCKSKETMDNISDLLVSALSLREEHHVAL